MKSKCEGLGGRELGFAQVTVDATHVPLGQFIFRQNRKEPGGRPTFGIGTGGDLPPELS